MEKIMFLMSHLCCGSLNLLVFAVNDVLDELDVIRPHGHDGGGGGAGPGCSLLTRPSAGESSEVRAGGVFWYVERVQGDFHT